MSTMQQHTTEKAETKSFEAKLEAAMKEPGVKDLMEMYQNCMVVQNVVQHQQQVINRAGAIVSDSTSVR